MNRFVNGLKIEENKTFTENGATALKSTNDSLVDLFAIIGALRSRTDKEIEVLFSKAFAEDKLLATKMSFYSRDIREGGQGERRTPKVIWRFLAFNHHDVVRKNIHNIAYYGRFDDLYCLIGTPVEDIMWDFMKHVIETDIRNMNHDKPITLAAKWLKSCNASSKETVKLGKMTAKHLGMSIPNYRKMLSKLRKYIDVTETKMSSNKWLAIDYEKVPSKAMNIYRDAFQKHDVKGFKEYLDSVSKGEAKINASTLFPYDIAEKYLRNCYGTTHSYGSYYGSADSNSKRVIGYADRIDPVLEAQWKALPNYVDGENNVLVMADVSGSMSGRPMATSVGLATYFAQRNKGIFHNLFMSFSSKPQLVELQGDSLFETLRNVVKTTWSNSTNIESAFNLVLKVAKDNRVSPEEMPKAIVIISDMEFDYCSDARNWVFYDSMKLKFTEAGYDIPNIVFWDVASRHDVFHAYSKYKGVQLASGQSASTFKHILENLDSTPYEAMVKVLNSPAYDRVVI